MKFTRDGTDRVEKKKKKKESKALEGQTVCFRYYKKREAVEEEIREQTFCVIYLSHGNAVQFIGGWLKGLVHTHRRIDSHPEVELLLLLGNRRKFFIQFKRRKGGSWWSEEHRLSINQRVGGRGLMVPNCH